MPLGKPNANSATCFDDEVAVDGPAGTLMIYKTDVFHRGSDFKAPGRSRFAMLMDFKTRGWPWQGKLAWPNHRNDPGLDRRDVQDDAAPARPVRLAARGPTTGTRRRSPTCSCVTRRWIWIRIANPRHGRVKPGHDELLRRILQTEALGFVVVGEKFAEPAPS